MGSDDPVRSTHIFRRADSGGHLSRWFKRPEAEALMDATSFFLLLFFSAILLCALWVVILESKQAWYRRIDDRLDRITRQAQGEIERVSR